MSSHSDLRMPGLLLMLVMLAGCTSLAGSHAAPDAVTGLRAGVEFIDDENQVVDAQYQPRHLVLVFPYIPGQLFGTPGSDLLFTVLLTPDDTLQLDLSRALPGLQAGVDTLQATGETAGLSARPARTRFARIGTFPFDAKTREPLGAGGFIDGETREHLLLTYFDRPCVLSGTLVIDGAAYVHDIRIPAAGFHWLRIRQQGDGRYVVSRTQDASRIVFTINPDNLQQT